MTTRTLIAAALLFATGCVTNSGPMVAVPTQGQAPTQQAADATACEKEAAKQKDAFGWGWGIVHAAQEGAAQVAYKECMTAKGYTVKD